MYFKNNIYVIEFKKYHKNRLDNNRDNKKNNEIREYYSLV